MSFIDRLQQKPEVERKKWFWLAVAAAGLLVIGIWALSFSVTLEHISLKKLGETAQSLQEEEITKPSLLDAALGQRFDTLKKLFPFLERTVPGREEIIK